MSPTRRAALLAAVLCVLASPASAFYDRERYKSIVFNDFSNDDAIRMNAQELITRSGFSYERYLSVADDGYVTQLLRLVNPQVRRSDLRPIPLLMYHGNNFDQSSHLCASSKQHHPEKWPRAQGDPPVTSSNRSLAFFLSNQGVDVWLIGQRATNKDCQGFVRNVTEARSRYATLELTEADYTYIRTQPDSYFSYTLDEIIAFELREQIDRVFALSNASEIAIYSYSVSTATTMAFLGQNHEYARRVRLYVQTGPEIAADHFTAFDNIYFEKVCPLAPSRGVGLTPTYLGNPLLRETLLALALVPALRYSAVYEVAALVFGPSPVYNTNLERNVVSRLGQPVSFRCFQQYCQNSVSKLLAKFDYGALENLRRYGQPTPPAYNVSELPVQNYAVLGGTYDGLADGTTVQRLIERTHTPRPVRLVVVQGANHLDFLAGTENDLYVNLPVLQLLQDAYAAEGRLEL